MEAHHDGERGVEQGVDVERHAAHTARAWQQPDHHRETDDEQRRTWKEK